MNIRLLQDALGKISSAALIFSVENNRYFTSFPASDGILLVTGDKAVFFTDSRYIEAAKAEVTGCDDVLLFRSLKESVLPVMEQLGVERIEIEASRMTVAQLQRMHEAMPHVRFYSNNLDDIINGIRAVKTHEEIVHIERAQRIAEKALDIILPQIRPGAPEQELALMLDYTMRRLGADAISFETILVSGKNSSKPHGVPSGKLLERGDFVTIDFGAVVNGYHSDMTRTFALGEISDKMKKVYDTVLLAQTSALDALRPGLACREADAIARNVIADAGYGDCFGHGLGHGVGVEIHEAPNLSPRSNAVLQPGNVVTVEPGIYLENAFGVRIEDMALITESGYRNLTTYPKDLMILG